MKTCNNTFLALFLILLAFSSLAGADCVNSDVAGKWRLFLVTGSASFQGFARATVEFTETGSLIVGNSKITNAFNQRYKLKKGSIAVTDSCRITGSLFTKAGPKLTIVDGQMNSGKDVISGVYRASTNDFGLINLIK